MRARVGPSDHFPGQFGMPLPSVELLPGISHMPTTKKLVVHPDGLLSQHGRSSTLSVRLT